MEIESIKMKKVQYLVLDFSSTGERSVYFSLSHEHGTGQILLSKACFYEDSLIIKQPEHRYYFQILCRVPNVYSVPRTQFPSHHVCCGLLFLSGLLQYFSAPSSEKIPDFLEGSSGWDLSRESGNAYFQNFGSVEMAGIMESRNVVVSQLIRQLVDSVVCGKEVI